MNSEIKLQQLIANIEDQKVAKVNSAMQFIDLESLQQKFENGNTILHYVFSSNTEIIKLFIEKLEILLIKDISKEDLRELFQTLNDGNFTPIDRIFQNNPKKQIKEVLEGIHSHDVLEVFLESEGEYGTLHKIAHDELYLKEKDNFLNTLKKGIHYLHDSAEYFKSWFGASESLQKKQEIAEKYFGEAANGHLELIKNEHGEKVLTFNDTISRDIGYYKLSTYVKEAVINGGDSGRILIEVVDYYSEDNIRELESVLKTTAHTKALIENDLLNPDRIKELDQYIIDKSFRSPQKVAAFRKAAGQKVEAKGSIEDHNIQVKQHTSAFNYNNLYVAGRVLDKSSDIVWGIDHLAVKTLGHNFTESVINPMQSRINELIPGSYLPDSKSFSDDLFSGMKLGMGVAMSIKSGKALPVFHSVNSATNQGIFSTVAGFIGGEEHVQKYGIYYDGVELIPRYFILGKPLFILNMGLKGSTALIEYATSEDSTVRLALPVLNNIANGAMLIYDLKSNLGAVAKGFVATADGVSLVKGLKETYDESSYSPDYYYHSFTNPLSILWERQSQTYESISKTLHKLVGKEYVLAQSESSKINIEFQDTDKYYDIDSIKGVSLVKGHILTTNEDKRFGEWSGMSFDEKGDLIFISDRGAYLKNKVIDSNGNIIAFENSIIGNVKTLNNKSNKKDFEELSIFKNDCFITNESTLEILLYKHCDLETVPSNVAIPDWKKDLFYNKGIEAFDISNEGKFLAIAEYNRYDHLDSHHKIYYWDTENEYMSIGSLKESIYITTSGYGISGLAFLQNGDVIVLERFYQKKIGGFAEDYEISVKHVKKHDIENNEQITGKEILHIDNTSSIGKYGYADNFESIAVKTTDNSTSMYLLTDDNRAPFQRSILLEFELKENFDIDT